MIKGCKKNVIYLKNTESDAFDEAYFIVSEESSRRRVSEKELVSIAGRLAFGGGMQTPPAGINLPKKEEKGKKDLSKPIFFLLGVLFTLALNVVTLFLL